MNSFTVAGSALYRAAADYSPANMSRSRHPHLELALVKGDEVRVIGPTDSTGYLQAVVNGKTGLIPAHHLVPARPRSCLGQSEQRDSLQDSGFHEPTSALSSPQRAPAAKKRVNVGGVAEATPQAPSQLKIHRIVGDRNASNRSLLIGWMPPADVEGVAEYKIYVNGSLHQTLCGANAEKALVRGLDLHQCQHISLYAVSPGGAMSPSTDLVFEGIPEVPPPAAPMVERWDNAEASPCLAIYDYDPAIQSGSNEPHGQLQLLEGDAVITYGPMRVDGFYRAEVNGKRGMVPSSFIEKLSKDLTTVRQKVAAPGSTPGPAGHPSRGATDARHVTSRAAGRSRPSRLQRPINWSSKQTKPN
ncbi:PREDICTED: uncharacterized protein LOC106810340 [Priapulus caudatus]|uniref:Uncharacterized protein LOC106810340 n=1 Tax=Priapulus caudatus TaxID=37621 RepID=A0ABM1EAB7_PRICU|nr:PREDICTED: uncharacterized protein LOC106810340 [Priapulus caudatus]